MIYTPTSALTQWLGPLCTNHSHMIPCLPPIPSVMDTKALGTMDQTHSDKEH